MKLKKAIILGAVAAGLPLAYIQASKIKFDQLFKTKKDIDIEANKPDGIPLDLFKNTLLVDLNWLKDTEYSDFDITSYDGLKLHAVRVKNNDHKLVILLHGVNNDHYGILHQAHIFYDLGFDVLMCDLRAHGKSEGEYTSLGFKEGIDLAEYVSALIKEDPSLKIGIYGIGLGAQAVLQYLAHDVKENVIFTIIESAFIDAYDQLAKNFSDKLLFNGINDNYRRYIGLNLDEISGYDGVISNHTPTLFLHSAKDPIVDVKNTVVLSEANSGPKDIHIFEKATHMGNYLDEDYPKVIENFIKSL